MLTKKDLGGRFRREKSSGGGGDGGFGGCLAALGKSDKRGPKPLAEREAGFVARSGLGMPGIFLGAASYAKEAHAERLVDAFAATLEGCGKASWKDKDGTRWRLQVSTDQMGWAADAEEQYNLRASGRVTAAGVTFPVAINATLARIANTGILVMAVDFKENLGLLPNDVTRAAVARLRAVMAGEKPPPRKPLLKNYRITQPADLVG